jgi:predicted DNA-binding transcriptional regulator YafY
MFYQRSLEIERRLETALELIRSGGYSTPMLAEKLGVSIPTVSRHVTALRERGHNIRSERTQGGWRFILDGGVMNGRPRRHAVLTEGRFGK